MRNLLTSVILSLLVGACGKQTVGFSGYKAHLESNTENEAQSSKDSTPDTFKMLPPLASSRPISDSEHATREANHAASIWVAGGYCSPEFKRLISKWERGIEAYRLFIELVKDTEMDFTDTMMHKQLQVELISTCEALTSRFHPNASCYHSEKKETLIFEDLKPVCEHFKASLIETERFLQSMMQTA